MFGNDFAALFGSALLDANSQIKGQEGCAFPLVILHDGRWKKSFRDGHAGRHHGTRRRY